MTNMYKSFQKVIKIIDSMRHEGQVEVTNNCIDQYERLYPKPSTAELLREHLKIKVSVLRLN